MVSQKTVVESKYVNIQELDIHKLHPTSCEDTVNGSKYIIIGKPGTGKSKLIEWIAYNKRHIFPVARAFSGSEDSNKFFQKIIPKSFIYNGLDISNMVPFDNLKLRQTIAKKHLIPRGYNPWTLEILDDCTTDTKFLKEEVFQQIYKNGRHWTMMHILSLQYCLDIKANIRACVDGIFILREANPAIRKKLYENYGQGIDSLADFNDLMDQLTENFSAMYINNKAQTNNIEDIVFFCKADITRLPEEWRLGADEYWDFHSARYDPNNQVDN